MDITATTSSATSPFYAATQSYGLKPDTVTRADFLGWSPAVQASFVRTFGQGSPLAILLGAAKGEQAVATLNETGTDVDVTEALTGFDTPLADLSLATFRGWPNAAQVFYVQVHGAGDPPAIEIDPKGTPTTATLDTAYGRPVSVALTSDRGMSGDPATVTAASFFALTPEEQYAYVKAKSTAAANLPPAVTLKDAGANPVKITLSYAGKDFSVGVPLSAYPGYTVATVGSTTFQSWPEQVQASYIRDHTSSQTSYPKTLALPDGKLAALLTANSDVDVYPLPSGFSGATADLTPSTYLGWPAAVQLAYIRKQGTSATIDSPNGWQTLTATLSTNSAGFTLASFATTAIPPAVLDLALFQLWPATDQAAYVAAQVKSAAPGGGALASVVVGSDRTLLTLGSGGGVTATDFPAGFATAPADLAPATFLSWSPAFRALYVRRHSLTTPDVAKDEPYTVVLGANGPTQATATVSAKGGTLATTGTAPLALDPSRGMAHDPDRVDPETGIALDIATGNIFGSATGLDPDPNRQATQLLFPTLDGTAGHTILDKPATVAAQFALPPNQLDPADFGKWHSAIQLEYLRKYGDAAKGYALVIGPTAGNVTAFIGTTGTKVYTVEALQKTDIAKLPLADQTVLAGLDAFTRVGGLAESLQLTADRSKASLVVQGLVNAIQSGGTGLKGGDTKMSIPDRQVFLDELALVQKKIDAGAIFSVSTINDQVSEISKRFERVNCFSGSIQKYSLTGNLDKITFSPGMAPYASLGETITSFLPGVTYPTLKVKVGDTTQTMAEFVAAQTKDFNATIAADSYTKKYETPLAVTLLLPPGYTTSKNLSLSSLTFAVSAVQPAPTQVSLIPGNGDLAQGYQTFMAQERQILSLANARQHLADTGTLQGSTQKLDVPNLIYLFQLYANLAGEAKIRADTEEINQTNAFLKVYSTMQDLVNKTVQAIKSNTSDEFYLGAKSDGNPIGTGDADDNNDDNDKLQNWRDKGNLTDAQKAVVAMFKDGKPLSPIEAFNDIARVSPDNLSPRKGAVWSTYGQQLGERVSLINQASQVKMNDVNSATKAKDRNFDLANNALTKMNEIVQKIASVG